MWFKPNYHTLYGRGVRMWHFFPPLEAFSWPHHTRLVHRGHVRAVMAKGAHLSVQGTSPALLTFLQENCQCCDNFYKCQTVYR